MWLIVIGEERQKLSLLEIYEAYQQRYDVEHFFRFGKQKMLLSQYQTPETSHEEKWWKLVHLAYLQLWVAKEYAVKLPDRGKGIFRRCEKGSISGDGAAELWWNYSAVWDNCQNSQTSR